MLYGRQINLSVYRKNVNVGIFSIPDQLFDDSAQKAAFLFNRGQIHSFDK